MHSFLKWNPKKILTVNCQNLFYILYFELYYQNFVNILYTTYRVILKFLKNKNKLYVLIYTTSY